MPIGLSSVPRAASALLVLALLLTACGARLTDEQREFAIAGAGSGQPGTGGGQAVAGGGDGGFSGGGVGDVDDQSDEVSATVPEEGQVAGPSGGDGAGAAASGGAEASGAVDGSSGGGQEQGSGGEADTRAMPEGGNGGATDTGVSQEEIVLSNVSDVSGAVPGLFEPSQLAAQAYVEFFSQTEGTLFGRSLRYLPLDSQLNAGANRSASIEACERSFASIGSMSAFDQGGAPVIDECGIPDIRTAATTPPMQVVDNAFPISTSRPDRQPLSEYTYFTEAHPNVVDKAAYLYIAGEVTEEATRRTRQATSEHLGWDWIYVQDIDIAETNYAPFVLEMRDRGVEFVTFQGAYQQAVRLAEAMQQQGFEPEVYALQSNTYIPDMLELGGSAMEGTYVSITSVMVEEIDQHPELQRYAAALQQVAPGESPTSLGMYSWSAGKLFVEIAKRVGPELTRDAVLEELAQIDEWDGGGLHPPRDISSQAPSPCFTLVQVRDGKFVRAHPAEGFDCSGDVVEVS